MIEVIENSSAMKKDRSGRIRSVAGLPGSGRHRNPAHLRQQREQGFQPVQQCADCWLIKTSGLTLTTPSACSFPRDSAGAFSVRRRHHLAFLLDDLRGPVKVPHAAVDRKAILSLF